MAVTITITDAGRAAIVDAENTGTDPVTISEIGIGNGSYTTAPDATATALKAELKRLTTISGEIVADDTFHVTVKDEGNDEYSVTEFGLYLADGTLFAIYAVTSGAIMQKAAASSVLLAVDIILTTVNAAAITFGDTSFTNPPASETKKGVIEIADDAEAIAGDDLLRAMPSKRVHDAFKQFGLGSDGVKITDANAALLGGDYYHDATAANIPLAAAGTIHVSAGGANDAEALTQTWIQSSDTDEHRMFIRHRRGVTNGWTNWKLVGEGTPAGAVEAFAISSAPTGWLKANGAAVSRTSYADLFSAIGTTFGTGDGSTTFNLPDLRGEFVRGWDDGRGVDPGRGLGVFQSQRLPPHSHPILSSAELAPLEQNNYRLQRQRTEIAADNISGELRPRNIALLYCIKY